MVIWLLMISVAAIALSGFPGLLLSRLGWIGQWIAAVLNVTGSILGGAALVMYYANPGASSVIDLAWSLPLGRFSVALDDLSLIFLIPIFLISALGSIYGLTYWRQREHPADGRKLRVCWGLLTAGMALVVLARDGALFVIAWEVMALAAFFLVATEENKRETRQAAWVYLVAAHVGSVCLIGFFALLRYLTGSFALWSAATAALTPDTAMQMAPQLTPHLATALFLLGVAGFGLKAGVMPLHVWLPGAHANAPSHVSAIFSGVMLNAGVYGLVRMAALLPKAPVWWGITLLAIGGLSAVMGISFAAAQRDFKRLLAYSSIENVGIVILGLGLATLGRSLGRGEWVALGLGGALLHMLNHSLFKPLLFMGAGGVLHATHTRDMDLLGGLGKRMPRTFVLFAIGCIAICGLPPLNGFVGELFLYIGFFRSASIGANWAWVALAAPVLAMVGALAVASFVKLLGAVFAGAPRSPLAAHAHECDRTMLLPMWILGGCCVVIGILPVLAIGILDRAIAGWAPQSLQNIESIRHYVPLAWLSAIAMAFIALVALAGWWFYRWPVNRNAPTAGTWDCGYARPTPRMQYTGSSSSQMLVELLAWVLWPRRKPPVINTVLPANSDFQSDVPDVVLDRALLPALNWSEWLLGWARFIQRGPIQVYLLYVLGILILLLLFA